MTVHGIRVGKETPVGNFTTLVDDEYFDLNGRKHHFVDRDDYVNVIVKRDDQEYPLGVQRFVLGNPIGQQVDHINCDKMNNLPENLRAVSQAQNIAYSRDFRRENVGSKRILERWNSFFVGIMVGPNFNSMSVHRALDEAYDAYLHLSTSRDDYEQMPDSGLIIPKPHRKPLYPLIEVEEFGPEFEIVIPISLIMQLMHNIPRASEKVDWR